MKDVDHLSLFNSSEQSTYLDKRRLKKDPRSMRNLILWLDYSKENTYREIDEILKVNLHFWMNYLIWTNFGSDIE